MRSCGGLELVVGDQVRCLGPADELVVGREADLVIDDNPFLHRRFLHFHRRDGLWVVSNVGSRLGATVSEVDGALETFLPPGRTQPLGAASMRVAFTAGAVGYELLARQDQAMFPTRIEEPPAQGSVTVGVMGLSPDHRRLIVALAEERLRSGSSSWVLPTSAAAAARLGWSVARFNRKLDFLCQKLAGLGVDGLHGGPGALASGRRSRLVDYAMATRLISTDDLILLDDPREDRVRGAD